jgi:hypothetical protein
LPIDVKDNSFCSADLRHSGSVIVYVILDARTSPDHPLGDAVETFLRREDAERFLAEVCGDDPELGSYLRIADRKLEARLRSSSSGVPSSAR